METTSDAIPERLVAALAGRFRVEREVGAGGSATVYLAEDLKHHRRVAIKVLKPQVAAALGPERFEDEVRIAANLHHPHILTVHDSGEADGLLYYVMPYVDGQSLRERLDEGGLLPFPKVAKLLAEVADALAYAHAAGIVHRDIKPENILYNGKHVVVTDFGIAKAISDAADRKSSTSMGIALGTPAYMAPEQASSDPSLDHRADLYSLGIVGYELLVGHPPFSGSAQQILTSHLTTKPEPIRVAREAVPPALAAVVMRALAKSPDERWPSAEAMQAQLEPLAGTTSNSGLMATVALATSGRAPKRTLAIGIALAALLVAIGTVVWNRTHPSPSVAVAATPAKQDAAASAQPANDRSIAVLPFANMSADKDQAYFSDGISEELLNLLSKIPELTVIARTSSFQFRDQDIGIQEIGRKLNVASVLQGSVRRSGDTVRITVQLIRAKDGANLWSETYDRKLDDIFKVQDEIAATVVDKLKLTLLGGAPKLRLSDPKVYPLLLQANALNSQGTKQARVAAIALFKRILEQSPREAQAWVGLSRAYINQATMTERPRAEAVQLSREASERALALDSQLALPYTFLGKLALDVNDLPGAAAQFEKALAIDPASPAVLQNVATFLGGIGRLPEAVRIRRWAAQVDPTSPTAHSSLCAVEYNSGNYEPALAACRTVLLLQPDSEWVRHVLSGIYLLQGDNEEAFKQANLEPNESARLVAQSQSLYALGRKPESNVALQKLIAGFADDYPTGPAEVYAPRGDNDLAFEWLERARAAGDPEAASAINNPVFNSLHKDPRWLPFLRKMGLAPEQLAKIKFEAKLPE